MLDILRLHDQYLAWCDAGGAQAAVSSPRQPDAYPLDNKGYIILQDKSEAERKGITLYQGSVAR